MAVLLVAGLAYADNTRLHWLAEGAGTPVPLITPTLTAAEPDRVVGVQRKCDVISSVRFDDDGSSFDNGPGRQKLVDEEGCDSSRVQLYIRNHRLEVTVRTSSGGSYVVTVPPKTTVKVGDRWPPE